MSDVEVHNNTVVVGPAEHGVPSAVRFDPQGASTTNLHLRNNIFRAQGVPVLVEVVPGQTGLLFQGNDYFCDEGGLRIAWCGTTFQSLAAWRRATGQERVGAADVGFSVDPKVQWSSDRPVLAPDSPLIDRGLDLKRQFGIDVGRHDLDGTPLPRGAAFDIGADEFDPVSGAAHRSPALRATR
jgi:hypothetical protein